MNAAEELKNGGLKYFEAISTDIFLSLRFYLWVFISGFLSLGFYLWVFISGFLSLGFYLCVGRWLIFSETV